MEIWIGFLSSICVLMLCMHGWTVLSLPPCGTFLIIGKELQWILLIILFACIDSRHSKYRLDKEVTFEEYKFLLPSKFKLIIGHVTPNCTTLCTSKTGICTYVYLHHCICFTNPKQLHIKAFTCIPLLHAKLLKIKTQLDISYHHMNHSSFIYGM